jgi:hypothetical protein
MHITNTYLFDHSSDTSSLWQWQMSGVFGKSNPIGDNPGDDIQTYQYKFIMSLGLMAVESPALQTKIGELGGLGIIIGQWQMNDDRLFT